MNPKLLLLLLSFISSFPLSAQNYAPIQDSTLYNWGKGYSLRTLTSYSVNGTKVFEPSLQAKILPGNFGDSYEVIDQHWIGKTLISQTNGRFGFVSGTDDTLWIEPAQSLGASWVAHTFSNGDYLEGSVSSIQLQALGNTGPSDSIKTLSFEAYNSLGSPLSHPWSGKELQISKNYGLFQSIDLASFPQATDPGIGGDTLSGFENSSTTWGYRHLDHFAIFDLEPGMELHYLESSGGCNSLTEYSYEAWVVKNVQAYANFYVQVNYDIYKKVYTGTPPSQLPTLPFYVNRTYTYTPGNTLLEATNYPAGEPQYLFDGLNNYLVINQNRPSNIPGRDQKKRSRLYQNSQDSSLYEHYDPYIEYPYSGEVVYSRGLGITRNFYQLDCGFTNRNLVHYQDKNGSWGDRYAHEGDRLNHSEEANSLHLQVYPNPSQGPLGLRFSLDAPQSLALTIYTLQGRRVYMQNLGHKASGEQQIALHPPLPPGNYLVRIEGSASQQGSQILIIQ